VAEEGCAGPGRVDPSSSGELLLGFACPSGEVAVKLEGLSGQGGISVRQIDSVPDGLPNAVTPLPLHFEVTADDGIDFASATLAFPYDDTHLAGAGMTGVPSEELVVLHGTPGGFVDVTSSARPGLLTGRVTSFSTFALARPNLDRLAGDDRVATAARVAEAEYTETGGTVVVATAEDFPDALAGGPLAGRLGAPILLTGRSELPAATLTQLQRLAPREILLLGGAQRIDDGVAAALGELAPTRRLAGADRFATAAAISAATFEPNVPAVYLATGGAFPDALAGSAAAGAAGGPVLLLGREEVPAATQAELARLRPQRVVVVLGGSAAVSDDVVERLRALTGVAVERVAGADRYATAAAAAAAVPTRGTVYVATGTSFPDALAGGALAARDGGPVLLVEPDRIPEPVQEVLDRLEPDRVVVLGGSAAVGDAVAATLRRQLVGQGA